MIASRAIAATGRRCVGSLGAGAAAAPFAPATRAAASDSTGRKRPADYVLGRRRPCSSRQFHSGSGSGGRTMSSTFSNNDAGLVLAAASMAAAALSWHHHSDGDATARCEASSSSKEQDRSGMVDRYVDSIWTDPELIQLPLGLGKSAPLFDSRLCRALVRETVNSFDATMDSWNNPQYQAKLVGHPIVYAHRQVPSGGSWTKRSLVHHVSSLVPFECLDLTADVLVNDPRVSPGIFPKAVEKHFIKNILHVLGCILLDLLLSTSISVQEGAFEMSWTYDKAKQCQFFENLTREQIQALVQGALSEIDFDVVKESSMQAVGSNHRPRYGEASMYNMAYIIMLIMFYMFNMQTDMYVVGRLVKQQIVHPSKSCSDEDE